MNPIKRALSPFIVLAAFTLSASTVTLAGLGTITDVSFPTTEWWGYLLADMPDEYTKRLVNTWLWYGAVAGTIIGVLTAFRLRGVEKNRADPRSRWLFGTSKFATPREGRKSGLVYSRAPRGDCILLGRTRGFLGRFWRYVCLPGVEHVILYAKTGSGKGVSYVIANCFNYTGSLVLLDIKLDGWKTTAAHRETALGQDVFLFSPLAADGCTHCWNPLGDIGTDQPDYISKLQRRSFNLFPEVDDKSKFWQDGARSAFLGVSILVCETPELDLTPSTVFRFFTRGDGYADLVRHIEGRRAAGKPYSQTCVDLISDALSGTDEVVNGIRKHVTVTMGLWNNPKIAAATSRSDFSLRDLRRRKMTIYVGVMPSDLEQLGGLLRLFFLQLFEANTDSMPDEDSTITHRAHILLDELTALPVMRAIAKATGFARGFWLQFSFVVQSKNQVREEYKENGAASLLENVGAEIIFGTDNHELCKEVSERAGTDTVDTVSRSAPRLFSAFRVNEQNENVSHTKRELILPQEVARLPLDEELMFRASVEPFHLKRLKWYTDANFKDLASAPPEVPRIVYCLSRDDGSIQFASPDDMASKSRKGQEAA